MGAGWGKYSLHAKVSSISCFIFGRSLSRFFLLWVAESLSEANDDDDTLSPRTHYIFMGKYFLFSELGFFVVCAQSSSEGRKLLEYAVHSGRVSEDCVAAAEFTRM